MTYERATGRVRLFIDGRKDGDGTLTTKGPLADRVARIGFTAPDFPQPASFFHGRIAEIRLYKQAIDPEEVARIMQGNANDARLVARWSPDDTRDDVVRDETGRGHDGQGRPGGSASGRERGHPGRRVAPRRGGHVVEHGRGGPAAHDPGRCRSPSAFPSRSSASPPRGT